MSLSPTIFFSHFSPFASSGWSVFALLVEGGFDQSRAFHVITQAMEHEFLTAASQNQEMTMDGFMTRAKEYARQALEQRGDAKS